MRYVPVLLTKDKDLVKRMHALAKENRRFGYRRIAFVAAGRRVEGEHQESPKTVATRRAENPQESEEKAAIGA